MKEDKASHVLLDKGTYETICYTIWGCVPVDVNWAINTNIFKEAKQALKTK